MRRCTSSWSGCTTSTQIARMRTRCWRWPSMQPHRRPLQALQPANRSMQAPMHIHPCYPFVCSQPDKFQSLWATDYPPSQGHQPDNCWIMQVEEAGLLQPREQSRAELSELLQEGLSRRQSAYLSQAERERNDILEATQGDTFPSPPDHKLVRMASQLPPAADPAGQSPSCRPAQMPQVRIAMPELSPKHQQGAQSRLHDSTTSCKYVPCSIAHAAGHTVLRVDTQNMT